MSFKVLVTDGLDPEGIAVLRKEPRFVVDEVPTLPPAELLARVSAYDAIVGRSATRISAELLRAATKLRVVGRAGVGVDNIALDVATELGVAVINAPAGNTVAVAELFFVSVLALLRHVPRANATTHEGRWERDQLMGTELRGRTLGVIGVGRIGTEVARRARSFGMSLIGFDPYISEERFAALDMTRATSLDDLLRAAHIVTVHTPLTDETRGMLGARELALMQRGAVVANLARGGIVDEPALAAACRSGQLLGACVDAFTKEPIVPGHALCGVENIVLTPHLGASTAEAQRDVAVDVCEAVRDALIAGELSRSINVASDGADWREIEGALVLARRAAAVARAWLADREARAITEVTLRVGSALKPGSAALLSSAAVGALAGVVDHSRLNLVNARSVATARGIALAVLETGPGVHAREVEVRVRANGREMRVGGLATPGAPPRLTRVGEFQVDVAPRGTLIVLTNRDVPGVIGRVGTALGNAGVNIAEYHQARLTMGGEALALISVDGALTESNRAALMALPDVNYATVVTFSDAV